MRRLVSLIIRQVALLQACAALVLVAASAHAQGTAASAAPSGSSEWVGRTWRTDDGLPQNTINTLLQTRDGFLWVGTNGGLARFDGLHFRNFGLQDGLRAVLVMSLAETSQGELWVGTSGGGVSRWEHGRFITYGEAEGFPEKSDVLCMEPHRDGSLWLGTTEGLVHWSGGKFTKIGDAHGLPETQVRAMALDAEGVLWVSVIGAGVYQGKDGKFVRESAPGPVTGDCYSLITQRDGTLWAGAGNGRLWKRLNGTWQEVASAAGLPKLSFVGLAEGMDGTLWLTLEGSGLYRSDGEHFAKVDWNERDMRVSRKVVVDRSGSIWLGSSSGGLTRLSPRLLYYWGTGDGGKTLPVATIAEAADGVWWVGTGNAGLHRFERGEFTEVTDLAVRRVSPNFYCGATGADGSIWMAGEQFLHRFATGQPVQSFLEPPIEGEAVRAMCVDGDVIWLGTYYSALLKYAGGKVETVAPAGSFSGGIASLALESPGVLWVGSSGGLHRWESGATRKWDTKDGLLTQSVNALYRESDGTLWIGTLGGGLARMKEGRISNYTTREGLIDDIISQIIADDAGNLWLGCNRGIMRIERGDFDAVSRGEMAQVHPMVFGRNEGMLKEQCTGGHSPTVIRTRNGRLLFPTVGGVVEIDPQQLRYGATAAPKADIESLSVNGHEIASGTPRVAIPPGPHHLEVKYTAPALSSGELVRFRYRIEGLDSGWVVGGSRRRVSYDGLPPGRYTFHVVASDDRGNWSEQGASFALIVRPFFWQTIWFRVGGMLLLIGVGGFAAWWHARNKHLRQLADLERARQQHAELAHASRVSLLGELSASLAHELKQPLTSILSNAQAALRFLNDPDLDMEEVRSSLNDIADADRRANEIIERMRAMIKKGEADMELRDINADIHHALLLIHSDLVGRNVLVSTSLSPDLPMVSADHIQLQQVLINLIINGCDAMSDGLSEERQLFIETKRDGAEMIRVSVSDRGTGITPEMQEQMFKPFYSTKKHGLGMGLSICRAIIRAHGGQLWAENGPDGGAVFHFTLRLTRMAITDGKQSAHDEFPDSAKSRG